ncbi:unnamed protein product [Natator depressus]
MYFLKLFSLVPSFFFSVLFCHTASSSIPFPPTGTSFLSCVGSDSPPSPTNTMPDVWASTELVMVMLLPPFLSDQAQHVSVQGTFHLFCQATGPSDARFVWTKNGQKVEVCVSEQSHALADGRVHILSWVKDAVAENSEYHCSVLSKAGNKSSKVLITVEGKDSAGQAGWVKEYDSWKSAVSEHHAMMQSWKTTWESCKKKDTP